MVSLQEKLPRNPEEYRFTVESEQEDVHQTASGKCALAEQLSVLHLYLIRYSLWYYYVINCSFGDASSVDWRVEDHHIGTGILCSSIAMSLIRC